jgi:hypothetical protein
VQHFQSFLLDEEQELLGGKREKQGNHRLRARNGQLGEMTQTACQSLGTHGV